MVERFPADDRVNEILQKLVVLPRNLFARATITLSRKNLQVIGVAAILRIRF